MVIDLVGKSVEAFEDGMIRLAFSRMGQPFQKRYLRNVCTVAVSRAPVRVDSGGWSDCWWFLRKHPGFVCNLALALYSSVVAIVLNQKGKVHYHALDIDKSGTLSQFEGDFVTLAAEMFPQAFDGRMTHVIVNADAPPKAGLGSSGSVGVAIVALLAHLAGKKVSREEIALLAHNIEHFIQRRESGIQDQVAAAFGSSRIEMPKGRFPHFNWSSLLLPPGMRQMVESSMILVDTGEGRSSSEEHERKIEIIKRGGKRAQEAFGHIIAMVAAAKKAAGCLEKGNWSGFCNAVGDNWGHQMLLDEKAVTPRIALITDTARGKRAKYKGWGAAGGGVLGILCPEGRDQRDELVVALQPLLNQMDGASIIPTALATSGVEVCSFTGAEFKRLLGQ